MRDFIPSKTMTGPEYVLKCVGTIFNDPNISAKTKVMAIRGLLSEIRPSDETVCSHPASTHVAALKCDLCGELRLKTPEPQTNDAFRWICIHCTTVNGLDDPNCLGCRKPRYPHRAELKASEQYHGIGCATRRGGNATVLLRWPTQAARLKTLCAPTASIDSANCLAGSVQRRTGTRLHEQ